MKFLDNPGHLAGRGIGQRIAERLGLGALLFGIAGALVAIEGKPGHRRFLFLRRVLHHFRGRGGNDHIDVNAFATALVLRANRRGDHGAPIAALREPGIVAKRRHQFVPGLGNLLDRPAGHFGFAGKSIARQRGDHEMISIVGRPAMRKRVGKRPDHIHEFEHRARPAMGQQERASAGFFRADMEAMDINAINLDQMVGIGIERSLTPAPVIAVPPIGNELFDIGKRDALVPIVYRFLFGETGERKPGLEIIEHILANIDREIPNFSRHACSPLRIAVTRCQSIFVPPCWSPGPVST